jgi:hypothetical protein
VGVGKDDKDEITAFLALGGGLGAGDGARGVFTADADTEEEAPYHQCLDLHITRYQPPLFPLQKKKKEVQMDTEYKTKQKKAEREGRRENSQPPPARASLQLPSPT